MVSVYGSRIDAHDNAHEQAHGHERERGPRDS